MAASRLSNPLFEIETFLESEARKDLLRFTTAGSVDDGKSTLIGRLLYDSRNVYEDQIRSVANLTRQDAVEFLALAPKAAVHTTTKSYALTEANQALDDLRAGRFQGAAVLVP